MVQMSLPASISSGAIASGEWGTTGVHEDMGLFSTLRIKIRITSRTSEQSINSGPDGLARLSMGHSQAEDFSTPAVSLVVETGTLCPNKCRSTILRTAL